MNRIDLDKRVVHYPEKPIGKRLGFCRGMLVTLDLDEDFWFTMGSIRVYGHKIKRGRYSGLRHLICTVDISQQNLKHAYHIDYTRLASKYQGHGIMPYIYRYVMKKTGIILQAGRSQSPGGRSIWAKLCSFDDILVAKAKRKELIPVEVDEESGDLAGCYDRHCNVVAMYC